METLYRLNFVVLETLYRLNFVVLETLYRLNFVVLETLYQISFLIVEFLAENIVGTVLFITAVIWIIVSTIITCYVSLIVCVEPLISDPPNLQTKDTVLDPFIQWNLQQRDNL